MTLHRLASACDPRSSIYLWYEVKQIQNKIKKKIHIHSFIYQSFITSFSPISPNLWRHGVYYESFILFQWINTLCFNHSFLWHLFGCFCTHHHPCLFGIIVRDAWENHAAYTMVCAHLQVPWPSLFFMTPTNLILCNTSHIFMNFAPIKQATLSLFPFAILWHEMKRAHLYTMGAGAYEDQRGEEELTTSTSL